MSKLGPDMLTDQGYPEMKNGRLGIEVPILIKQWL
jgi:hypothetical protein